MLHADVSGLPMRRGPTVYEQSGNQRHTPRLAIARAGRPPGRREPECHSTRPLRWLPMTRTNFQVQNESPHAGNRCDTVPNWHTHVGLTPEEFGATWLRAVLPLIIAKQDSHQRHRHTRAEHPQATRDRANAGRDDCCSRLNGAPGARPAREYRLVAYAPFSRGILLAHERGLSYPPITGLTQPAPLPLCSRRGLDWG